MMLTPRPVTAFWQHTAETRDELRILRYYAQIWRQIDGTSHLWTVHYTDDLGRVHEIGTDVVRRLAQAKIDAENTIFDHHEDRPSVRVESGVNYRKADFGDGSSVVMETVDEG